MYFELCQDKYGESKFFNIVNNFFFSVARPQLVAIQVIIYVVRSIH